MGLRRAKGQGTSEERWLEVDATMTGSLAFKDPVNLSINGRFDGTLETKGRLSIGSEASVKATINGEQIVIGGQVDGTVVATRLIEILATGRLCGKVTTPRLVVHDGGVLQGTLEMGGPHGENQRWMTVDELARYLEIEVSTVAQWVEEGRLPGQRDGKVWRFDRSKIEEWLTQEKIK